MATFDIDGCIDALLAFRPSQRRPIISEKDVRAMADECKGVLMEQPAMLELNAPIRVVGDVHGQFMDLLRLFGTCLTAPNVEGLSWADFACNLCGNCFCGRRVWRPASRVELPLPRRLR
jgi:serine/threonine-protein phosphatase PP1 catalytic subunit